MHDCKNLIFANRQLERQADITAADSRNRHTKVHKTIEHTCWFDVQGAEVSQKKSTSAAFLLSKTTGCNGCSPSDVSSTVR